MPKKETHQVKEKTAEYKALSDAELISILEKRLPEILKKKPSVKKKLKELFSDVFVEKGEIKEILLELRKQREDFNRRFEEMREDTNKRFEAVDKRFELITEEMKKMREDTNRRFEEMRADMDRRFEALDRRFELITEEMKKMREDTNRRFEEMREDTNKRFEAVDKRFELITEEMKKMREDTNKRFEAVDRRFELITEEMKKMRTDMDTGFKKVYSKIDTLGSRWGIMAEGSIRESFREILSDMGFEVVKWRKKDEKGEVFLKPRDVEIDILIKDGKLYAIEVKSSLTASEVDGFTKAVKFYEKSAGRKVDKRFIVCIYAYPGVKEYAESLGVKLLSSVEELGNE